MPVNRRTPYAPPAIHNPGPYVAKVISHVDPSQVTIPLHLLGCHHEISNRPLYCIHLDLLIVHCRIMTFFSQMCKKLKIMVLIIFYNYKLSYY